MRNVSLSLILMFVLFSCKKEMYDHAYARIVSPADSSTFKSGNEINFVVDGRLSSVSFESDELVFKIIKPSTQELLFEEHFLEGKHRFNFTPSFNETTELQAVAEYWRTGTERPDTSHQIHLMIIP